MKAKGEITVFLSLIFILLVSFIGTLVKSADLQVGKNQRRAVMDRAVYSVFGEYQKDLLEDYEIFAVEGSYENGNYSEEQLLKRLEYFGAESLESEITGIQYLTDLQGTPFFHQVVTYMRDYSGIQLAADLVGSSQGWTEQEMQGKESEENAKKAEEELENSLQENDTQIPNEEDNPLPAVNAARNTPLLSLIMPQDKQVSNKAISLEQLVSHRNLRSGRGTFQITDDEDSTVSNLLFGEYLLSRFANASEENSGEHLSALDYEMEYMIAGRESDMKNLESVARRILLLRMGINIIFLHGDVEKQAEAEALAATLSTLVALPVATELVKQAILAGWAYGESIMDLRSLLAGKKVALVKSKDTWQLSLSSLAKLGTVEDEEGGQDDPGGISYKDYLRILLFLENKQQCSMRALDLIEQNLCQGKGKTFFRADQCVTGLQLKSKTTFERGITYEFPMYFAYK